MCVTPHHMHEIGVAGFDGHSAVTADTLSVHGLAKLS